MFYSNGCYIFIFSLICFYANNSEDFSGLTIPAPFKNSCGILLQYVCRLQTLAFHRFFLLRILIFHSIFPAYLLIEVKASLRELPSAIPLTYWIVVSFTVSTGVSPLPFIFKRLTSFFDGLMITPSLLFVNLFSYFLYIFIFLPPLPLIVWFQYILFTIHTILQNQISCHL